MTAAALLLLAAAAWGASGETDFQAVVVRPGDTLWGIAQKYLKDPSRWDEILKHNRLPSADPSVALPGMTLQVPVALIKEDLRAAKLIQRLGQVMFRRKETADWKGAQDGMELFRNDTLRTLERSRARVRFLSDDFLQLDANSLAIIKPLNKDYDVDLKRGGVFVGRAKVVTASAKITPKTQDTKYAATVRDDLSTLVEVYTGKAAVESEGQTVDVAAGMATNVRLGLPPAVPTKIADLPAFEARVAEFEGRAPAGAGKAAVATARGASPGAALGGAAAPSTDELRAEVDIQRVGEPISGYRVQFSASQEFDRLLVDRSVDADTVLRPSDLALPSGRYWVRIALIDLLGTQGRFSAPKAYSLGPRGLVRMKQDLASKLQLTRPAADETVSAADYRVTGRVRDGLSVTINGRPARVDGEGNFGLGLVLSPGDNILRVVVMDSGGNTDQVVRRVVFRSEP